MSKVTLSSARTVEKAPEAAAEELMNKLGSTSPKLVTLFASREHDQTALNRAIRARLPKKTRLIGASTAGEIDNGGMHQGAAILAALSGDFDVGLGLGKGLEADAMKAGSAAMACASYELGTRPEDVTPQNHVGLVLDDAFKEGKKEEVLLGMMERNQSIILVGGGTANLDSGHRSADVDSGRRSADVGSGRRFADVGQDRAKPASKLHVDGEVVDDATLIALFRTKAPWRALRSHWYVPAGQTLRITRVDPTHMRALEIDGKPAAARYAEILGIPVSELAFSKPTGFSARPTALKVGREYFLRAPSKPLDDGSVLFDNLLEEGQELELMRMGDIRAITRRFFEHDLPQAVRSPQALLLFHCGDRARYAAATGHTAELDESLRTAPPCAGLHVNFEIYGGFHINTTMAVLAFGDSA